MYPLGGYSSATQPGPNSVHNSVGLTDEWQGSRMGGEISESSWGKTNSTLEACLPMPSLSTALCVPHLVQAPVGKSHQSDHWAIHFVADSTGEKFCRGKAEWQLMYSFKQERG